MFRKFLVFLALAALTAEASAWGNETYPIAARRLCGEFDCGCESSIIDGAIAPDLRFKDTATHHCYEPIFDLSQYPPGAWSAPNTNDCPALDKVRAWIEAAANDTACKRWYDLGVGLHYFLDSREIWNDVFKANRTCANEQESEIDDYLRFGGTRWKSCSCGVCITNDDFVDWLLDYRERIKQLAPAKKTKTPSIVILSNTIDRPAAAELGAILGRMNVSVTQTNTQEFARNKNKPLIVVAGGQNAPEVGQLVSATLTDEDKAAVMKSVFTGVAIKKTDVWVSGQTVYFIAGWGQNETADGLIRSKGVLFDEAKKTAAQDDAVVGCQKNSDCGTSYYGPYVCSTRKEAARVLYTPTCVLGDCTQRAGRPSTVGCGGEQTCLPFRGCVFKDQLSVFEGIRTPTFYTWLSTEWLTAIAGKSTKVILYAKSYLNQTMQCQYYDNGWNDMGALSVNNTVEVMLNISSNNTGKHVYVEKIRCGNETSESEFIPVYYSEQNITLNVIPPPLIFTITITPQTVSLKDCFDRGNVTLKVENLCSHNITCEYSVGGMRGRTNVLPVGQTYNITGGYWTWTVSNTTYSYLDYYSGTDFTGEYTVYDENETEIIKNYSESDRAAYVDVPTNLTIFTPSNMTKISNTTNVYDYPHWTNNVLWVTSKECTLDRIPVTVKCTDSYGQTPAPQKKDILLKVAQNPKYH